MFWYSVFYTFFYTSTETWGDWVGHKANKGNIVQSRENNKHKSLKLGTCLVCSSNIEVDDIARADRWRVNLK